MNQVKIIETPRDGWQGIQKIIPAPDKIKWINKLLKVGFDTVEVGSFVSSQFIPQLADTAEVMKGIEKSSSLSKLMVLVADEKGADKAVQYHCIDYLLFPFSASPTFLKKNINSDFKKSWTIITRLTEKCHEFQKTLIAYITMGFGNPYGDEWNVDLILDLAGRLHDLGLRTIPLSDITGEATAERIDVVYNKLLAYYPDVEFGLHLHANPHDWYEKVDAAYRSGCRRFDTVLGGLGGCPMTGRELLGNLDTRKFVKYLDDNHIEHNLNKDELKKAMKFISEIEFI